MDRAWLDDLLAEGALKRDVVRVFRPLRARARPMGAVAGSMEGLRGRAMAKKEAGQTGAQQAVQANQAAVDTFKRAASAGLDARGYSVK